MLFEQYQNCRSQMIPADLEISSMDGFISFKRKALTVLILDCVKATSKYLVEFKPKSVNDVLQKDRIVNVQPKIRDAWNGFHNRKQKETLLPPRRHQGL